MLGVRVNQRLYFPPNVNDFPLSAPSPPASNTLKRKKVESPLRKAESRAVDLSGPGVRVFGIIFFQHHMIRADIFPRWLDWSLTEQAFLSKISLLDLVVTGWNLWSKFTKKYKQERNGWNWFKITKTKCYLLTIEISKKCNSSDQSDIFKQASMLNAF
jgi:hypothetical protein